MLSELQGTLVPAPGSGGDSGSGESEYDLIRWIAGGSFGKVFVVVHRNEGKQYVMKEVAPFACMEEKQREATELEVHLLREMLHPNIVAYRDSYVNQGGHLCIFMEYCEHGDVHSYLKSTKCNGKPLPGEGQVLEWLVQITLALQALHARRILHRDLKTQNVFLTGQMRKQHQGFALKLGDLGIARVLDSSTELAATQIGTPFSMSPEVFNSKPYGYESDVWGLGCVFYELVNGTHAFEAQSINGLALKILRGRYTPITSTCSEDTKQLIKWMLNTTPKKRPKLQDILQSKRVRQQIPDAVRAAAEATESQEAKAWAEEALAAQLGSLGLEDCCQAALTSGGATGHGGGSRARNGSHARARDKRQALLSKHMERTERRKRREEEILKRLQETADVLNSYFEDPVAPGVGGMSYGGYGNVHHHNHHHSSSGYGGQQSRPCNVSGRGRQLPPPLAHLPQAALSVGGCTSMSGRSGHNDGEMSHRDRVLMRKEQRREEEQQKFEDQARKIREENLARQRAWVQGSKEQLGHEKGHTSSGADGGPRGGANAIGGTGGGSAHRVAPPATAFPGGRPATLVPPGAGSGQGRPPAPLQPLVDYAHLTSDRLAKPLRSHRPPVMKTPRSRFQSSDSVGHDLGPHAPRLRTKTSVSIGELPCPPAVRCGEPLPPSKVPRHRWNHWGAGGGDISNAGVTSRSLHSIYLESLPDQHHVPEHSDESDVSNSCSEVSDGGLGSTRTASDEQLYRQSQDVQERISLWRAQISKHKITLEALQEAYADECLPTKISGKHFGARDAAPSLSPAPAPAQPPAAAAPALVQDRVARLRRRCLEGLGSETFQAARECLQSLLNTDEVASSIRERMLEMLGLDKIGYYSMIDQIVHLEQRWGSQERGQQLGAPELTNISGWRSFGPEQTAFAQPWRSEGGRSDAAVGFARSRSPG
mmetsp:Transcript_106628/g.340235  ORF Transcript_106628/g.340235 Transcript_106628/m.340235 type:complete len:935 (-) Transcript_106628:106-2910(-)